MKNIGSKLECWREKLFPCRTVRIGRHRLRLDLRWKHERNYYNYVTASQQVNTIAADVALTNALTRSGDVVLDAGANIGFTAILYLEAGAAEVHAFEPVPELYRRLKTVRSPDLHTYHYALSNCDGSQEMVISIGHNQGSTLNRRFTEKFAHVFGDQINTIQVPTRTIDSLFPNKAFDLIKLDVEGSEVAVAEGAFKNFSEHPPRVLVAEVYDELLRPMQQVTKTHFKYGWRVGIDSNSSRLRLFEIENARLPDPKVVSAGPPVYVFSNHRIDQEISRVAAA